MPDKVTAEPGAMSVPVVVVTGFLGAGKTTFINDLLLRADGQRIAAIVNDFGSINIDAALLSNATEEVIGLKNGCICCSLQGDLLRTLRSVLAGRKPDLVVIEASGVADPGGIVQALMDPVLVRAASLDGVVCIVDAEDLQDGETRWNDPLWLAQLRGSDMVQLSKVPAQANRVSALAMRLTTVARRPVFGTAGDVVEIADLVGAIRARPAGRIDTRPANRRFATLEWTCAGAVDMRAFQAAIQRLAPSLLRAKGFLTVTGASTRHLLFQMVGRRASVMPADLQKDGCDLILIVEREVFDPDTARRLLAGLSDS